MTKAEFAVITVDDVVDDIAAFGFERVDHRPQIVDAIVDHERRGARRKLLRVLRRRGYQTVIPPVGLPSASGPVGNGAAPIQDIDAEVLARTMRAALQDPSL